MAESETRKKIRKKYDEKCVQVKFRFIKGKDDDILQHLKNQPSMTSYIRSLIRNDMNGENPK